MVFEKKFELLKVRSRWIFFSSFGLQVCGEVEECCVANRTIFGESGERGRRKEEQSISVNSVRVASETMAMMLTR